MIGLQALAVALARGAVPPRPALFRLPGLPVMVRDVYRAARDMAELRTLDWALAAPGPPVPDAAGFATILDMRDFAFDPAFRGVAMIDYFLTRLGVDPTTVPPASRRNAWLRERLVPGPPLAASDYALLCPDAAMPVRTMPPPVAAALERGLAARGLRVLRLPTADSLEQLCGWVAGAAVVVSVDTGIIHLADAVAAPSVAIFTTHRPQWRVRDYPLCTPIHRPIPGFPEALEFATDAEVAAARAPWGDPDGDPGSLAWLESVVDAAEKAAHRTRHVQH